MKAKPIAFLALLLATSMLVAAPAGAVTTASVAVMNFGFTPKTTYIAPGSRVAWSFKDAGVTHTSTSNQLFWNSGDKTFGQTYTATFNFAGSFGYHCMIHPDMIGTVYVRLAHSGTPTTGYVIRWSALATTPSNRNFDVQIKLPGTTTWRTIRTHTTHAYLTFNPATNGTYGFRARTDNVSNGEASGWSPALSVLIS